MGFVEGGKSGFEPTFFVLMIQNLVDRIQELLVELVDSSVYEVDSLRVFPAKHRWIIDVKVDRLSGKIALDECADINRRLAQAIEDKGLIENSFVVEVSSPGLDKPLKSFKDFRRVLQTELDIQYQDESEKSQFGRFKVLSVTDIGVEFENLKKEQKLFVPYAKIQSAKRVIDYRSGEKRKS